MFPFVLIFCGSLNNYRNGEWEAQPVHNLCVFSVQLWRCMYTVYISCTYLQLCTLYSFVLTPWKRRARLFLFSFQLSFRLFDFVFGFQSLVNLELYQVLHIHLNGEKKSIFETMWNYAVKSWLFHYRNKRKFYKLSFLEKLLKLLSKI